MDDMFTQAKNIVSVVADKLNVNDKELDALFKGAKRMSTPEQNAAWKRNSKEINQIEQERRESMSLWMKPDEVKTALVISGGAGDGLGETIGALTVLQPYWERNDIEIDAVVGTSQGALSGGMYAECPTVDGVEAIKKVYLTLSQRQLFGKSGLFLDIEIAIRTARLQFNPNSLDSILEGNHTRDFLEQLFGDRVIGELALQYAATVMDCSNALYRVINSETDPKFLLRHAAYASAAQPPFFDPLQFEIEEVLIEPQEPRTFQTQTITLADGGGRHVIPFESAVALYPNLECVWILAKHGTTIPKRGKVSGLINIAGAYVDAITNQNILETLEGAGDIKDGIETHIILVGEGIPGSGFFDFTDRLVEFVDGGAANAAKYLSNPKPKMIVSRGSSAITKGLTGMIADKNEWAIDV